MIEITVSPVTVQGPSYGPSTSFSYKTIIYAGPSSARQAAGEPTNLVVPWHDLPENPSLFALLSWHTRISDFVGRDKELEELHLWATSPQAVSIKFVTGTGGVGKSRLAAEFATELQKKEWAAGFVDLKNPKSYQGPSGGILLIIDYPEENKEGTRELLQILANLSFPGRLRVLFLTRQKMGGWREVIQDTRAESLADMKPIRLRKIEAYDALGIYLSACEKAGNVLDCGWIGTDLDTMAAWIKEAPENDLPLFITAAAVYNVLEPEDRSVRYTGREVVDALVDRELTRLRNVTKNQGVADEYLFAKLLALATIAGVIPASKIDEVLDRIGSRQALPERLDAEDALHHAGLLQDRELRALKPDIVAAAFVTKVFGRKPERAPELLWVALAEDMTGGIGRFARLSYDAEVVLGKHEHRLSTWLAQAVEGNIDRARILEPVISPKGQLPVGLFDGIKAALGTILLETKCPVEKARIYNNLSVCLFDAGDRNGALTANVEAMEIYEQLAAANPEAFEPYLARSLNNLGACYSELGKHDEALEAAKRSVLIRERLAAANPEAFEPDLASSLNNLGGRYDDLGKRDEALQAAKRSVLIRERLAAANPEAFEHDLAMSLNNLGILYSELGKLSEAIDDSKRAVEIYERLAAANPEAFEPYLASSLNNLGNSYSKLGKHDEALEATKRAVETFERLAAANPEAFEPDLALSLHTLGIHYSFTGRRIEALAAAKRAVETFERLAAANPEAFELKLATSLDNLGICSSVTGRLNEALEATKRTVEIRERLAAANLEAFGPDLAGSLNNLGNLYYGLGRYQEAAEKCEKAVQLDGKFVKAWLNWGLALKEMGEEKEAQEKFKKAEELGFKPPE